MKIDQISISHPDKIIFPKKKITKGDIARYYEQVANKILPFLKNRPLTLQRFPSGIEEKGFYQKNVSDYFPKFIKRVEIETEEGINTQFVCNNKKALLYLVNQNTLTFHIWPSRIDKIRQPDKVIFDLDPPQESFQKVKQAVRAVHSFLIEKNINPQLMSTGQNGFHLFYSIRRGKNFDKVKEQVHEMAENMVKRHPNLLTTKLRKDQREGKVFVDYLRNEYGQTSVCPYSLRANEAAGIAMPLDWKDFPKIKSADAYNFNTKAKNKN